MKEKKIVYSEPASYFPKEIREEFFGEKNEEPEKNKKTNKKPDYMVEGIQKLTYEKTWFDVRILKVGRKERITIKPDGSIKRELYARSDADTTLKKTETGRLIIEKDKVMALYQEIVDCMRNSESVIGYIDDGFFTVKLEYSDGEITIPRGLSSGEKDLNQIMVNFFSSIGR